MFSSVSSYFKFNISQQFSSVMQVMNKKGEDRQNHEAIMSFVVLSNKESKAQQHVLPIHLSQFITSFQRNLSENFLAAENLLKKKWSDFNSLCRSFEDSAIASALTTSQITYLFFDGLCMGTSIEYLGKFFKNRLPLSSSTSPFPVSSKPYVTTEGNAQFYRFILDADCVEKQTSRFRFMQIAYKVAYALNKTNLKSREIIPEGILRKNKLEITKRIPDPEITKTLAFPIKDLVPELKKLISSDNTKAYLLAMGGSSSSTNHVLTLYLHEPFHFVDPSNGIGFASNKEDLILFLASYIDEKFPKYSAFSILELKSLDHMMENKGNPKLKNKQNQPLILA